MPLIDRTLANGIRLLIEPIAATKAAAIGFWFPEGSRDEKVGEYGITHLIEHLLFKGTSTLSAYQISRFFDRIGGYVNAFTERETMCLHCTVPFSHAVESLQLMFSMLRDSRFSETDIQKERDVVVTEILSSMDDPEEMAVEGALNALYPGHALSRPIAGTLETIQQLDARLLYSVFNTQYRYSPPLITIAGNVDSGQIIDFLESVQCKQQTTTPILLDQNNCVPGNTFLDSDFAQTQVIVSFPLSKIKTLENWFSFAVINAIIGDTVSSRLFQELRENRGLCYSVYSFFSCYRESGLWSAYVATSPEKTHATIEVLLSEIDKIINSGIRAEEIIDAKAHIAGEIQLHSEDTEDRMKRLGRQIQQYGKAYTVEEALYMLEAIQHREVNRIVSATFTTEARSLFACGPKKYMKECNRKWV